MSYLCILPHLKNWINVLFFCFFYIVHVRWIIALIVLYVYIEMYRNLSEVQLNINEIVFLYTLIKVVKCSDNVFFSSFSFNYVLIGILPRNEKLWYFLIENNTIFQLYRDDKFVVEEAGVPWENHQPWASNWQTLSHASRAHLFS